MSLNQAQFKAILFDMDGVIIDTKELVESFWIKKMEFHGVTIDDEYFETRVHGRPSRLIIDELFSELPEKERINMEHECIEYDSSQTNFTIVPGVEQLLNQLVLYDIPFGLVTSAMPPKVDVMLNSLSLSSPFQTIVTANLVKNGKPNPECYLLGAEKLGVPSEKVLVFEDSVSGVKAAQNSGATVIGVNESEMAPLLKNAGAIKTIKDFSEVNFNQTKMAIELSKTGFKAHFFNDDY